MSQENHPCYFRLDGFIRTMRLLPAILLFAFALSLTSSLVGADTATGEVQGRVFNATSGAALRNARVSVEGTTRETFTDDLGAYHLYGMPAGPARVTVSYVGLTSRTVAVDVPGGTAAQQDFDLAVVGSAWTGEAGQPVQLATFTVIADNEMNAQAIALNERKTAVNISNVVAYDEFGDRGDEDIGEFLRFLPGVSIEDGGQVASTITLRGFPSQYTSIFLDGAPIAGARGNSRTQSLLDVTMGNMSRAEISKTPTPDMPASGLGGTINLITKSGLSTKKPVYNYQVYLITDGYTGLTLDGGPRGLSDALSPKYQQPSFNFNALVPLSKTFAVSFSGSRTWRLKPMEVDPHNDTQADWNLVNDFQRISTYFSLANILETWSTQVGFGWKPTPKDTLTFAVSHRYVSNYIMRNALTVTYGAGATGDHTFTQSATANGSVTQGSGTNQETGSDTDHATLKFSHVERDWRIDAYGAFSRSETFLDDIDNGFFNGTTTTTGATLKIRGEGTGESSANIPVRYTATNAAGAVVNIYDPSAYTISAVTSNQNHVVSQKASAHVDFTRDFDGKVPFTFMTGLYWDQQHRSQKGGGSTWSFNPNGLTTAAARNAANFDIFDEPFLNQETATVFGKPMRWISLTKLYDLSKLHPDWFVLDQAGYYTNQVNNSRSLIETISAAYVRGDLKLMNNRLLLVGGVRFEKTNEDGTGPKNDPNGAYRKNADGSVFDNNPTTAGIQPVFLPEAATDLLRRAQLRLTERGAHVTSSYDNYYPSLNVTYKLTDKLYLRAAYSKSIGRPDYGSLIPQAIISDTASTITVNNSALKPLTSDNYDFSVESYQIKGGFGSVGVFQKNIKDFIGSLTQDATPELLESYGLQADPTLLNYDIITKTNSGDAKISGLEFTYTQSLLFMPHWARGFQVFANGTKLHLEGSNTADFTGFAPTKYAGGINFVRPRYYIKLNFTYQGDTKGAAVAESVANGIPPGTYDYQGARFRVGLNVQYSISKHCVLFGSMTDINRPGFLVVSRRYADGTAEDLKDRRRQDLGSVINIGVKGTF
jgi:iron complex outermembrane receptor protein